MPLAKRIVKPLDLRKSKSAFAETPEDEFELFACLALVGAIRQMADLANHAESLFGEITCECERVFRRSESLVERISSLESAVQTLDPKKAARSTLEASLKAPPVRLFGSIEADHFLRLSCPDAIVGQYARADMTPVPLLRACDSFRRDGLHGSQYFQCQPIIADERRRRQLELEDDLKRPASICGGEGSSRAEVSDAEESTGLSGPGMYFSQMELGRPASRALTPAKPRPHSVACIVGSMDELDTTPCTDSIHLPTPEQVMQRSRDRMPSYVVPIDITGRAFVRMSALRQSAALRSATPAVPAPHNHPLVSPTKLGPAKQRSAREKRFRRQTISGIPASVVDQLRSDGDGRSTVCSSGAGSIGRPRTLHLGRPSRMGIKLRPSLSFDEDLPMAAEMTSPVAPAFDIGARSMSYREPRSSSRQRPSAFFNSTSIDDSDLDGASFAKRRGAAERLSLRKRASNTGKNIFMSLRGRSKSAEKTLENGDASGKPPKPLHRGRRFPSNLDDSPMPLNMSTGRRSRIPITFGSSVIATAVQMRNGAESFGAELISDSGSIDGSVVVREKAPLPTRESHFSFSSVETGATGISSEINKEISSVSEDVDNISQLSSIEKDSSMSASIPSRKGFDLRAFDGFSTNSADRESSSTTRTVTPTPTTNGPSSKDVDSSDAYAAADLWVKNLELQVAKGSSAKHKSLVKRRSKVVAQDDNSDSSKENTPISSLTLDNLMMHSRDNDPDSSETQNEKRSSRTESVDLIIGGCDGPGRPNERVLAPREDDETSVYSTDADGFYTSMRADCGLKRRSFHGVGAGTPTSPDSPLYSEFYGGSRAVGGGGSKEEPSIGTDGHATMPGALPSSSSTPQSLRSSKRSVSTLSTASNMTEASVVTVVAAPTPPMQRKAGSPPRPSSRPPPPPPPARKTSGLSSSDDEATANIYADLQNFRDQIDADAEKDNLDETLQASDNSLSHIREVDEDDPASVATVVEAVAATAADPRTPGESSDSSEPVYSRVRSKATAAAYLSLCSVTPVPSDQSDSENSYRMNTPDGSAFWSSPPSRGLYDDVVGSAPSTPRAPNLDSSSFISELQDVTKALEKFTFNSPLNDVRSLSPSTPDKANKSERSFDAWPSAEELSEESKHQLQPDLLASSAQSNYGVSASKRESSPYDRPSASPKSPSQAKPFFSVPSDSLPEPAKAVLVSSSVRTYEPKTNFCQPVLYPPQQAVPPAVGGVAAINMYSESSDAAAVASNAASLNLRRRGDDAAALPFLPSTFSTFGAEDSASSDPVEEAPTKSFPALPSHVFPKSRLPSLAGLAKSHLPLGAALADSGYASSSSFDVMSKSSTSAASSSADDCNSQMSSPNEPVFEATSSSKPDVRDFANDSDVLIRPNRPYADRDNMSGKVDQSSSSGSLERKRVAKVIINADGSVSPGNTLERPSKRPSRNLEVGGSADELDRLLETQSGKEDPVLTPTGSLERQKKKPPGARVNVMHLQDETSNRLGFAKTSLADDAAAILEAASTNVPFNFPAREPLQDPALLHSKFASLQRGQGVDAGKPSSEIVAVQNTTEVSGVTVDHDLNKSRAEEKLRQLFREEEVEEEEPHPRVVIMPDVVPLQEKTDSRLPPAVPGQYDVDDDREEYFQSSSLPPKLDHRVQRKFDELLEIQLREQLRDELWERREADKEFGVIDDVDREDGVSVDFHHLQQQQSLQQQPKENYADDFTLQQLRQNIQPILRQPSHGPPSKPPRKFNLDTLSRVIEEDEEELEAIEREENEEKSHQSREEIVEDSSEVEDPVAEPSDDEEAAIASPDEEEEPEEEDDPSDEPSDDALMLSASSEVAVSSASEALMRSEMSTTSTPDATAEEEEEEGEEDGESVEFKEDEVETEKSVGDDDDRPEATSSPTPHPLPSDATPMSSRSQRLRPTSLTLRIDDDTDDAGADSPFAAPAPPKTMNDLFAKIHESKKRMNVRSEYENVDWSDSRSSVSSASNSRSSSPVLSVASSVESGVLSPRCLTPTWGGAGADPKGALSASSSKSLASDRRGKKSTTSLHDFKMLLVQKTATSVGSARKISAVEMLKAAKSTPPSTPTTPVHTPFPVSTSTTKRFPFSNLSSTTNSSGGAGGGTPSSGSGLGTPPYSRSNPGSPRRAAGKPSYDPAVLGALRSRRLGTETLPAKSRLARPETNAAQNRASPVRHTLETLSECHSE